VPRPRPDSEGECNVSNDARHSLNYRRRLRRA
jgi:hypothetical protein